LLHGESDPGRRVTFRGDMESRSQPAAAAARYDAGFAGNDKTKAKAVKKLFIPRT
jgi:hypothetical protein